MSKRQRILDATDRLIRNRGLARVTTKEIAREAGCAEGTLYKHFEHKDDLVLAVVLRNIPKLQETFSADRVGKGDLAENLEQVALAAIKFFDEIFSATLCLLADPELLARHRESIRERNGGPKVLFQHVATYIQGEQRCGRADPSLDPLSVAALLLGPCSQWASVRQINGEPPLPLSDEAFVAGMVRSLLAGVTPRGGPKRRRSSERSSIARAPIQNVEAARAVIGGPGKKGTRE